MHFNVSQNHSNICLFLLLTTTTIAIFSVLLLPSLLKLMLLLILHYSLSIFFFFLQDIRNGLWYSAKWTAINVRYDRCLHRFGHTIGIISWRWLLYMHQTCEKSLNEHFSMMAVSYGAKMVERERVLVELMGVTERQRPWRTWGGEAEEKKKTRHDTIQNKAHWHVQQYVSSLRSCFASCIYRWEYC